MDKRFGEIRDKLSPFFEKARAWIGDTGQFRSKKGLGYGLMLVTSTILFLTMGGSRQKPPEGPPSIDPGIAGGEVDSVITEGREEMEMARSRAAGSETPPEVIEPVYETWGRDPFTTLGPFREVTRLPEDPGLSLSAISWKDGEAIALINDFVVREGDVVEGARVIDITSGSVILNRDGRRFNLTLSGG